MIGICSSIYRTESGSYKSEYCGLLMILSGDLLRCFRFFVYTAHMNHLNININTYERDGDVIIGDIHTIINQTDRLALIGPNGVGKSTLMRIISGQI